MKSEWIAALAQSLEDSIDKVPEGWKTARQIASEMGRSLGHTQRSIKSLVESGKAQVKEFKLRCNGSVRPVPHYRIAKRKAA